MARRRKGKRQKRGIPFPDGHKIREGGDIPIDLTLKKLSFSGPVKYYYGDGRVGHMGGFSEIPMFIFCYDTVSKKWDTTINACTRPSPSRGFRFDTVEEAARSWYMPISKGGSYACGY